MSAAVDAVETIPVLDLRGYLAGEPGAARQLAARINQASKTVGFYFIRNHGVSQTVIDDTFAAAARFHALPMERKLALRINHHMVGYLPMGGAKMRSSAVNNNTKHDLNEAFFVRRERAPEVALLGQPPARAARVGAEAGLRHAEERGDLGLRQSPPPCVEGLEFRAMPCL